MKLDVGDIAGLSAGLAAGNITAREAQRLLREWGTGDDLIDSILAGAAGLAVGGIVGSAVDSIFDGLLGDD